MISAAPFRMLRTIILPVIVICFTLTLSFGKGSHGCQTPGYYRDVAGDDSSSKANQPPADAPAANSNELGNLAWRAPCPLQ